MALACMRFSFLTTDERQVHKAPRGSGTTHGRRRRRIQHFGEEITKSLRHTDPIIPGGQSIPKLIHDLHRFVTARLALKGAFAAPHVRIGPNGMRRVGSGHILQNGTPLLKGHATTVRRGAETRDGEFDIDKDVEFERFLRCAPADDPIQDEIVVAGDEICILGAKGSSPVLRMTG